MIKPINAATRGTFIVFEGVDRCGKTTQCGLLLKHLLSLSIAAVSMRFPDRTTPTGTLIDSYLRSGKDLDDRAVHLLFSANRWESVKDIEDKLSNGVSIICDRYAYSGVAFTSAKTVAGLDLDWCMSPDIGLPAPDTVIFLGLDQSEAEKRGGYGDERYEKRDMQIRVRDRFEKLQSVDEKEGRIPWHVIDASQNIEQVQVNIAKVVKEAIERVESGSPLRKMWSDGSYGLPLLENPKL